jgi:tripartite-type tricarboxylate transporter receptor subunit TctC
MNASCLVAAVYSIFLASIAGTAYAQSYPAKTVRVIAPFPPGGGTDLFARTLAQKLSGVFGQQFIVDNRSGAGGSIGSELAARAAPDGYTLLVTSSSTISINPHLVRKPPYDPLRDFSPVINIASAPNVLVTHPSLPVRSVADFINLAKKQPGAINYASNGPGTLSHLTGELFKRQTGINLVHIPYKGGPPAVTDLMAGQVSALFAAFPTVYGQVRAGRLRAIAVSGGKRSEAAPTIPTVAETVPGFESVQWWAMFGPANLAADVAGRLNSEASKVLADAEVKARFASEGAEPIGGSAQDLDIYLKADYEKWGKVIKETGIRSE